MFSRKKNIKQLKRRKQSQNLFDSKLLIVVLILTIWGLIMVYSGSVIVAVKIGKSPFYYFLLQLAWVVVGSAGCYVAYKIDYKLLPHLSLIGLFVAFILLIAVLIINFNSDIKRWIEIGPYTLQPSEIAKIVFFIYISSWLAKFKEFKGNFKESIKYHLTNELLPFLFLLSIISIPILIEPDLDTTIIIVVTTFIVYFIAGNNLIHTLFSSLVALILSASGYLFAQLADYRIDRITNWFGFWKNNEIQFPFGSGYQLRQILVAVASGSFFGVGFGESRQKFHYLGETAFTDTIFAIFAEEFGLFGCLILITLFVYILIRGYKIAKEAPDKLGFYLALTITTWVTLQAFMHIGANVALIPINGNTLPFFSYGGSSTLVNLIGVGILLNISKHSKLK